LERSKPKVAEKLCRTALSKTGVSSYEPMLRARIAVNVNAARSLPDFPTSRDFVTRTFFSSPTGYLHNST
jgi:hypothetical protein